MTSSRSFGILIDNCGNVSHKEFVVIIIDPNPITKRIIVINLRRNSEKGKKEDTDKLSVKKEEKERVRIVKSKKMLYAAAIIFKTNL